MSTLFIFLFLLLTLFLILFGYKKLSLFVALITLISFIVIGNGFFPAYLLHSLQEYQEPVIDWKENNTIIVLGTASNKAPDTHSIRPSLLSFSRITAAAALYRRCKINTSQCHILISGGDPLGNGKSEAVTYRDILLSLGINPVDIQLESHSKNTFQNAEFTSVLLRQHPAEQVLLVTSGLTLKRALLYFSYFGIHPIPIPSDFIPISPSQFPSGYNLAISDFAIHEIIGICRFYIYNFFGWNKKSTNP
ncbi:MAG: YdcF family protein [Pseudomonadota bacterium]